MTHISGVLCDAPSDSGMANLCTGSVLQCSVGPSNRTAVHSVGPSNCTVVHPTELSGTEVLKFSGYCSIQGSLVLLTVIG